MHTEAGKAFTDLVLETFRLNGRLLSAGDRLTKPLGLTSSRWQVLGMIVDQSLPVAQIARNMGLARQNVQRLADALQTEGVVEYAANPNHQRAKLVCLTDKGRRSVEKLTHLQEAWANGVAACVSAAEIHTALEVLRKLRLGLEGRQKNV